MEIPNKEDISYFARTNFRNQNQTFGIKQSDRRFHIYIIGKTGTGKSTLIKNLLLQDVINNRGVALLDPHGDLVSDIYKKIPEERKKDVLYFDVTNLNDDVNFNPLENVPSSKFSLAASGLLSAFKSIWYDSWGPRLEHILRNAILALLEVRGTIISDILRLIEDKNFRHDIASRITNQQVKKFWLEEYESYNARFRTEAIAPLQNKVGAFISDPIMNRIFSKAKSSFHLRRIMDEGKILLVNLSKGHIGSDSSRLLGALMMSRIGMVALSRSDQPEKERKDFIVYLDEFQNYTTLEMAMMLSELRKYRLCLVLAHQYLNQVIPEIREAILGNAGTIISFRLGFTDAELIAKEFYPIFFQSDLTGLPNYQIYLKLMIDGVVSPPFSAETFPDIIPGQNREND